MALGKEFSDAFGDFVMKYGLLLKAAYPGKEKEFIGELESVIRLAVEDNKRAMHG